MGVGTGARVARKAGNVAEGALDAASLQRAVDNRGEVTDSFRVVPRRGNEFRDIDPLELANPRMLNDRRSRGTRILCLIGWGISREILMKVAVV